MLRPVKPVKADDRAAGGDPSPACASCHRAIYERYRRTPMANASGLAVDGFIPANFEHAASGVDYRISEDADHVWLSYERDATSPDRALKGQRELRYFIGSGKRGRTYLFEQNGYWFESPINWYAKKQLWDMAPNHLSAHEMPLTMPVDPGCLNCHASGVARSLPDARNHYAAEPFASGGIQCASCHGDGKKHIASDGKIKMLDINALEPVRRDSVCLNCHLEGQVAVMREGKEIEDFVPGDNLFAYTLFFIYRQESGSGGRATSQWEALFRSECKRKSGDKMTCTTCHDPHGSPPAEERVAFYRQRCLQCHNSAGFAEKHHPENRDCTTCHMATPTSNDIAHEQVTDHWIKKRISEARLPEATTGELETVGEIRASDRELGLAYAQMAARGDRSAGTRALELLRRAEHSEGATGDHDLHAELGFLEQIDGQTERAAAEYNQALEADPYDPLAGGDLALIEAEQHHYQEAERLWRRVFDHNPALVEAGMNLAIVECGEGEKTGAMDTLDRLLNYAPDDEKAREFESEIREERRNCGTK